MDADVCIVGAGAAGGIMASQLARLGVTVAVVEAGIRHDFKRRGEYVRRYLRRENPWRSTLEGQDRYTIGGRVPYGLEGRRARGIGGSTLHWEGYAIRLHENDFRLRSLYGVADDWPIAYSDLEPYYTAAESELGVAGATDDAWASPRSGPFPLPPFPFSYSDRLFADACRTVGVAMHHLSQARNSVPYGGRAQCRACSTCHVCPTGAKASIDLTHAAAAESTGRVRIITEATVLRLEADGAGAVRRAVYARPDRVERRLTARVFVLAAGAVENTRILLLSTSVRFPQGLANGSGLVGKFFTSHPSIDITARAVSKVHPYRIGFSTAVSRQFAVDRDRATRGAFLLEFLNSAGPKPAELALDSRRAGQALDEYVRAEFGHGLGIRIYVEQLPDRTNAVTLDRRVTDYFGSPVPRVTYSVGPYERAALDDAETVARRLFETLGATDIRRSQLSPAAHQIGTHRMGTDPRTSVVDPMLRSHEVPNLYAVGSGCFVTASAFPPTLTIAALALRAAGHIAARLKTAAGS